MQEQIEVDYQGDVYTGQYSVEGINLRQLAVYYNGRKRLAQSRRDRMFIDRGTKGIFGELQRSEMSSWRHTPARTFRSAGAGSHISGPTFYKHSIPTGLGLRINKVVESAFPGLDEFVSEL